MMPEVPSEPIEVEAVKDLLSKLPRPPKVSLPGGASDADIQAFSDRTGIKVPPPLAEWLKLCNGPMVGPGGLFGIPPVRKHLSIEYIYEIYPEWRAKAWIPLSSDGCGNYYILASAQDFGPGWPVLFIDTMEARDRPAYIVASGIWRFLVFLLEDEFLHEKGLFDTPWPFDRAEVTRRDPEIESFRGVPLPWEAD